MLTPHRFEVIKQCPNAVERLVTILMEPHKARMWYPGNDARLRGYALYLVLLVLRRYGMRLDEDGNPMESTLHDALLPLSMRDMKEIADELYTVKFR